MTNVSRTSVARVPSLPSELFEPFSHPGIPGAREALELIWPTFAEEAVRLFLEGHRDRFDQLAPTLASWLSDRITGLSLDEAWHPATGLMARPAGSTKRPVALAAGLALHLSLTAREGEWAAELEPDSSIRLRNLIGRPERVEVRADAGGANITLTEGGARASLQLDGSEAPLEATGPMRRAGIYLSSPVRVLLTSGATPGDSFFVEEADPFAPAELETFARDVQAAVEFVAEYAPDYVDWVESATTVLVPCRAPEEMMLSGSSNTLPGLIRITAQRPAETTAEMLVHEASHQYLHAALRVAPVDDGSDSETYYSPVKKEFRPLDKILTAYHAFANVEFFYATALENGWRPSERELQATRTVSEELDMLEPPLRENSALTTLGRALVDPLLSARSG
jgi:HEXXH motif-containing protein